MELQKWADQKRSRILITLDSGVPPRYTNRGQEGRSSKVPLRDASVHHPGLEGGELALVFAPAATYRNNEDKLRGGVNGGAEAWASEERGRDRGRKVG